MEINTSYNRVDHHIMRMSYLFLAMVREVVRVHDGTIEVYTNKHSGTTFEVKMGIGADFEKAV